MGAITALGFFLCTKTHVTCEPHISMKGFTYYDCTYEYTLCQFAGLSRWHMLLIKWFCARVCSVVHSVLTGAPPLLCQMVVQPKQERGVPCRTAPTAVSHGILQVGGPLQLQPLLGPEIRAEGPLTTTATTSSTQYPSTWAYLYPKQMTAAQDIQQGCIYTWRKAYFYIKGWGGKIPPSTCIVYNAGWAACCYSM